MNAATRRPLWLVGAALSIGAGVIHFALGPEHLEELGALGFGFYLSGALQVAWAAALGVLLVMPADRDRTRGLRAVAWSGIAINVTILAAWAFSRIVGLPAGETPWTPEAIGRPDSIAAVLEGGLVVGLAASLRGWAGGRARSTRWLAIGAAIALSAVVVGTVVAIAPDETGEAEGHHHAMTTVVEGSE
jgi:hypothetical protein